MFGSREEINKEDLVPRKDFEKLKKLVDVHQDYLTNLLVFYKLNPTPFLENVRNISYEFLRLFDNICNKHGLCYWLDYSTLLGAVRHDDFIPWDDDLDVGMMREDYIELSRLIQSEMDSLENIHCDFKSRCLQIKYHIPDFKEELVVLNVFPYDYIKGEPIEDFEDQFNKCGSVEESYENLNLNHEKGKYYISGVDGIRGKDQKFKFKILETQDLLPLQKLQFGKYEFPVPKDALLYVRKIYGRKFVKITQKNPKKVRLSKFREINNIEEILKKSGQNLEKINDGYVESI